MGNDYKKEARKQYLHYFRIWFIIVGVMAVILASVWGVNVVRNSIPQPNDSAPAERVYDYANVLTDQEEEKLRRQIAKAEKRLHINIVIVTINQSVEGDEVIEEYGSPYWEINMQNLADDFWDENGYGYNRSYEGDGMLLLHNWYEGQNGEHLSTSGVAERSLSSYDIDQLLFTVDRYYDKDLYRAYSEFVDAVVDTLDFRRVDSAYWTGVPVLSIIVAAIYAFVCLRQTKVRDTTAVNAYVVGGKPVMRARRDDCIRKHVTKRHIERSSSGGGGYSGGGGGGGGHHHSSSGASHGGGSHRH